MTKTTVENKKNAKTKLKVDKSYKLVGFGSLHYPEYN